MNKFVNTVKTTVSTLAVTSLLCGSLFAVNCAISEQAKALGEKSNVSNGNSANIEMLPSVVWAPDYEETIEKMKSNPEYYEEIANRVREEARRKVAEKELETASSEQKLPAVVYAPDYEETIEKMRDNPDNSPDYFDEYIRAKWGNRQSETMVAAE